MVLSVNKTRCGDEGSEKGDEILSTDRLAAVAPSRQLRRAFEEIENCLKKFKISKSIALNPSG